MYALRMNRPALVLVLLLAVTFAVVTGWWLSPSRGHDISRTHVTERGFSVTESCVEAYRLDPGTDALVQAALDGTGPCVITYG